MEDIKAYDWSLENEEQIRKRLDRQIDSIGSINGAVEVLRQIFETKKAIQGKSDSSEGKAEDYTAFLNFYEEYYGKISRKLKYIGCTEIEIKRAIEQYESQRQDSEKKYDGMFLSKLAGQHHDGKIKIYDWTTDTGELERRSIIYNEFIEDGKKYCDVIGQIDFENLKVKLKTAEIDNDVLKEFNPPKSNKTTSSKKHFDEYISEISEETSKKLKQEQKENFKKISEMIEVQIDLERINKIIDSIEIFEYRPTFDDETKGWYMLKRNIVAIRPELLYSDDVKAKTTRLHEFIHAIQMIDKDSMFEKNNIVNIFNEPQVQDLAETVWNPEKGKKGTNTVENKKDSVGFVINSMSSMYYIERIALLNQMEVALGRKFYSKNFLDRDGFYKDFAHKYGNDLMTSMIIRLCDIEFKTFSNSYEKAKYINETENILFKSVFNKDIDAIGSIDGAIEVLNKMAKMGKFKQQRYVISDNESSFYNSFSELYTEYYKKIGRKLAYIGYTKAEIVEALEPYEYKNAIVDDGVENQLENLTLSICEKYKNNMRIELNPNKIGIRYVIGNYREFLYQIYEKETGEHIVYDIFDSNISAERKKRNIEDENSWKYLLKSRFKPIFDTGKEFVELDVKKYLESAKQKEKVTQENNEVISIAKQDDGLGEK